MRANERRAEIMRVLVARRQTTVPVLAAEFEVSANTIRNDLKALALEYPVETLSGNGGGVKVPDWYHPHKNILSQEQATVLEQLMVNADEHQQEVLRQMLSEFTSQSFRQKYVKQEEKV